MSYPDQVLVGRWYATGMQKLRVRFTVPDNRSAEVSVEQGRIRISGALKSNGLKYAVDLRVTSECGAVYVDGDAVRVESECPVTFMLAARTNYQMQYPDYRCGGGSRAAAAAKDAQAVSGLHFGTTDQAPHATTTRRCSAACTSRWTPARRSCPPTSCARSTAAATPSADRQLEQLYFQYGRYLLIGSSRAGSLPANLQGVWNHYATPPWNCRLPRQHQPADELLAGGVGQPRRDHAAAVRFRRTPGARRAGSRRSDTSAPRAGRMFLNTNIWGYVGPIDWPTAFWQPEASAWLAQHFYEHYLFSRDAAFLKSRAWPVMKGAAEFWLDALVTDPKDGKLIVSSQLFTRARAIHGGRGHVAADRRRSVHEHVPAAARLVGDKEFAARVEEALEKLDPGLRVGYLGAAAGVEGGPGRSQGRSSPRVATVCAASGPRHRSGEEPGARRRGARDAGRAR